MWINNNVLIRAYNKDLIKGYKLVLPANIEIRYDSFIYCTSLRKLVIGNIVFNVKVVDGILFVYKNINPISEVFYEEEKHIKSLCWKGFNMYKVFNKNYITNLFLLEKDGEYVVNQNLEEGFIELIEKTQE